MRKVDIFIIGAICLVLLGGVIGGLFYINRPSPAPISIDITTQPDRLTFARGETISTTGMVITAHYQNGPSKERRSGFTISPSRFFEEGTRTITVTYRGKTDTYQVTIGAATLTRLQIIKDPTKTRYARNEAPDWSGMLIRLTWTDRTEEVGPGFAGLTFTGYNMNPPGTTAVNQIVTVTLHGRTDTFRITVG